MEQLNWSMEKISIYGNLLPLQAIIYDNKDHRQDTFIPLANAARCFDGLWLNDARNELNKIGFPEEEVKLIIKMNSKAIVAIDTMVGYTDEITLYDIVKQGAIMVPILCIVETD